MKNTKIFERHLLLSRKIIAKQINMPKKYGNVQKSVGDMMRGALLETSARTILNQGKSQGIIETKKKTALRMLQDGELSVEKIAKYSDLKVAEVEELAKLQTV